VSYNLASPDGIDNCNQGINGDGEAPSGQEGPIVAATSIPDVNDGTEPPVTVTDGDGVTYSFSSGNPGTYGVANVATGIVDPSGNGVSISISNLTGAVTYTDNLGRAALQTNGIGGNPDTITVAGLGSPYQVYWTTASANFTSSSLNLEPGVGAACPTGGVATSTVVSTIVLPNGQQFTLQYDSTDGQQINHYGMLKKIVYPSGGYVRYVWGSNSLAETGHWVDNKAGQIWACRFDFPAVTDRYVSFDGTTEVLHQQFAYSTNWPSNTSFTWTSKSTTVTTTDLLRNTSFSTVYTYSPVPAEFVPNCSSCLVAQQIPVEQSIQYNDVGGSTIQTVTKSWKNMRLLQSEQTKLATGQSRLTASCYDANEQTTEQDDYDLGVSTPSAPTCSGPLPSGTQAGSLLRRTATTYATFTQHIVDRPSTTITYDGSGNRAAETDFPSYDAGGHVLTKTIQCFSVVGGAACPQGNSTTTFAYDSNGQTITVTDPRLNQTTYSYADNYSSCGGSAPPTSPSDAYLTQVAHPTTGGIAHIVKYCYDYAKGLLLSLTDENNQPTTYTYGDSLDRLTQTVYPDGGQSSYAYNDTAPSPTITTSRKLTSSTNLTGVSVMNGMGRVVQTQLTSDPDGTDLTDTTYDGSGHIWKQSNPHRSNSLPTDGTTTYFYDALDRACLVVPPDGTLPTMNPCSTRPSNTILTTYTGNCVTVTDQAGNGRKSCSDGLGRLTQVFEDPAGANYETDYGYDALSNLKCVAQKGTNSGTFSGCSSIPSSWRPRTFTYDSLSHLTSATNPESGTVSYVYDVNGNLSSKTSPAPNQTGSATVTISYCYDQLNRMITKSYTGQSCPISAPDATYTYDQSSLNGFSPFQNPVGRLVMTQQTISPGIFANEWIDYDPMGRIQHLSQCARFNCGKYGSNPNWWVITNTYDLAGNLKTYTDGFGNLFTQTLSGAGRPTQLSSSWVDSTHPANLLSSASYFPNGSLKSATLGNGLTETSVFNSRLQPCRMATSSTGTSLTSCADTHTGDVLDFTYGYPSGANNGNISSWTATGNQTFSRSFQYDSLNRIHAMTETGGVAEGCKPSSSSTNNYTLTWTIDAWGNRTLQNASSMNGSLTCTFSTAVDSNNRLNDANKYRYDAAGNLTWDGNLYYVYDAENRISQVQSDDPQQNPRNCTTAWACYFYNAEGQRIAKYMAGGANTTFYIYGTDGEVVADTDVNLSWNQTYFRFGGRLLGLYRGAGTFFIHPDHLGSTRLQTLMVSGTPPSGCTLPQGNATSCIYDNMDYLPFGEQLAGSSATTHKFTGKERDAESGLDNFGKRYFGSSLGRFQTPDAFYKDSHVGDPQSWNEYAYARNNPLRYVDPTGQNATVSSSCSTDANNHTTCNVNISASIAIYAAPGSGLTQEQLNGAATTIQNSIQNAWSGSVTQDGVTYNVSTQVSVSVASSESDASKTGAQNVIGLSNGPADAAHNANALTGPSNSLGTFLRGQDTGTWNYNTLGADSMNTAAHEFTHLLGVDDHTGYVLSNTDSTLAAPHATAADLGWGIREATKSVGLGLSMKSWYNGPALPTPFTFSTRDNVGAPTFGWWK
jgi:RHS repeat-associated protein